MAVTQDRSASLQCYIAVVESPPLSGLLASNPNFQRPSHTFTAQLQKIQFDNGIHETRRLGPQDLESDLGGNVLRYARMARMGSR